MVSDELLKILPRSIGVIIKKCDFNTILELRISVNKPLIIHTLKEEIIKELIVSKQDVEEIILKARNYSNYAYEEEVRCGFITLKDGHRIGIFGECLLEDNKVKTMKNIASINIRFSREILGCGDKLLPYITEDKNIVNTLIIAPPRCGKTTILRDLTRIISNGYENLKINGSRVSVIDERSEIAASVRGISSLNLGIRTDILDNCPKSIGIMMAIRVMSPNYIICDEIGTSEDMDSIIKATSCGVRIITTIHGDSLEDLITKDVFRKLVLNNVFQRVIILSNFKEIGSIKKIYKLDYRNETYIEMV